MDIQATVSGIQLFSELLPIAEQAEVKLSFWGARYVCVAGYQGVLSVDALAKRVLELLEQSRGEFEETERAPGKRLAKRIDWIYGDIHKQFSEANLLTQTLVVIRELMAALFALICYGKCDDAFIKMNWYKGALNIPNYSFELYTDAQVQNRLGISPEEAQRRNLIMLSEVTAGKRFWLLEVTRRQQNTAQIRQVFS